jgi:hypothetical protein
VFCTNTPFDWFYVRLLRPLLVALAGNSHLLSQLLLSLSGGRELFVFEDGAYQLIMGDAHPSQSKGFDLLVKLSRDGLINGMRGLDPARMVYIGDSTAAGGFDPELAGKSGVAIDVGDAIPESSKKPLLNVHHSYRRTIDTLTAATATLRAASGSVPVQQPSLPEVTHAIVWTFEHPQFLPGRRIRVRVSGGGFVHAGITGPDGTWNRVYRVPLLPMPSGGYEAVPPSGVNAFTFFWTEAPWTPGHPGHWERGRGASAVFMAREPQEHASFER